MKSDNNFPEFENIINEMTYVYTIIVRGLLGIVEVKTLHYL